MRLLIEQRPLHNTLNLLKDAPTRGTKVRPKPSIAHSAGLRLRLAAASLALSNLFQTCGALSASPRMSSPCSHTTPVRPCRRRHTLPPRQATPLEA